APPLVHGGIHWQAIYKRLIEDAREFGGGNIRNLVLHGNYGWHTTAHQRRRRTRENVQHITTCAKTGIEHNQPQRAVAGYDAIELRGAEGIRLPVFVSKVDDPLARSGVKTTMPH